MRITGSPYEICPLVYIAPASVIAEIADQGACAVRMAVAKSRCRSGARCGRRGVRRTPGWGGLPRPDGVPRQGVRRTPLHQHWELPWHGDFATAIRRFRTPSSTSGKMAIIGVAAQKDRHHRPERRSAGSMSKVLLVDDDPNIRRRVRACLQPEGLALVEAADGVEEPFAPADAPLLPPTWAVVTRCPPRSRSACWTPSSSPNHRNAAAFRRASGLPRVPAAPGLRPDRGRGRWSE